MRCKTCRRQLSDEVRHWLTYDAETMQLIAAHCEPCDNRRMFRQFKRTGMLCNRLTMSARQVVLDSEREDHESQPHPSGLTYQQSVLVMNDYDEIRVVMKYFELAVWFRGLQQQVRECAGPMSFHDEGWTMLVFNSGGRCIMTLKDDATSQTLTVITIEDEEPFAGRKYHRDAGMGPMGIQGTDCTKDTAIRLLEVASRAWPFTLQPDQDVFIA